MRIIRKKVIATAVSLGTCVAGAIALSGCSPAHSPHASAPNSEATASAQPKPSTGSVPATRVSSTSPIQLTVSLKNVAQSMYRVHLVIPVAPGPLTLAFPKWIPGAHAPAGPINNLAGFIITGNGKRIRWTRDPVHMYEFHLTVPTGVTRLDVSMDMLDMFNTDPYLADMDWSSVLVYPLGTPVAKQTWQANLVLPKGWKYATALTTTNQQGDTVHFAAVPLNQLVDSPVYAGAYYRKVPLASSPRVTLDLFADNPKLLTTLNAATIADYRKLPGQEYAMFGGYHYQHYDFLMALSNYVSNGTEHHQSSEDGGGADYYANPQRLLAGADLLSHEYTHSWDGKFLRPAGEVQPNYQDPRKDGMLWVYEGLTQYLGQVMATRIGLWTKQDYRESLAYWASVMQGRTGRSWRTLEDTSVAGPLRSGRSNIWANYRRQSGLDLYFGGVLLWMDVNTKIRQLSHDQRSLNTFCKSFFDRDGHSFKTVPYTFSDLVAGLNKVQPYDWSKFLKTRLNRLGGNTMLGGIERGGWKLVFTSVESPYMKAMAKYGLYGSHQWQPIDQMFSIGLRLGFNGTISDVRWNGPAFKVGLAPGMRILAVDGAKFTPAVFRKAIATASKTKSPIELRAKNKAWTKTYSVDYHGGLKFPHLARVQSQPDYLDQILAPLPAVGTQHAKASTKNSG